MSNQIFLRILLMLFLFSSCAVLEKKNHVLNNLNESYFDLNKFEKNYKGMTKEQIIYIFGNPIISDSFNDVFHYIICKKENKFGCRQKTLNIFFIENKVSKLDIQ
ncbi:outer membrane protein assembly factor BamE [Buchnera aphidicola]|uniref:Outer membrane protein assembly factor BamE n=1 Tax=Buchnera aphidicola subsp. Rhopalosiphum maidis TaxID=118109 RepID=A0A3G2I6E1_BUCRM|nr:outer membrane protein assembly factor BamE [Buchnera aphidicola]AYN24859.1 outer membrane protein assembly factor BamE [Buchnera aphidicola (Rhopalosiphum maidis)]